MLLCVLGVVVLLLYLVFGVGCGGFFFLFVFFFCVIFFSFFFKGKWRRLGRAVHVGRSAEGAGVRPGACEETRRIGRHCG